MNAKKLLAFTLSVLMMLMLFAGCSGSGGEKTTTAAQTTAQATQTATTAAAASTQASQTTTAPATTAAAATTAATSAVASASAFGDVPVNEQLDYINYDGAVPIVKEGQEVTLDFGVWLEEGFPNNVTENWFWHYVEDQLNIIPQVQQIMDTEKQNLLFASNRVPDIMLDVSLSTTDIVKYGTVEGQITSYAPYLEKYMPSINQYYIDDPAMKATYTTNEAGDIYKFPRILNDTTIVGSYIRKTWLDTLGLDTPTTIDEFTQVMCAFRDAGPEKLGVEKVIPIGGGYHDEWGSPMGMLAESFGYLVRPYFNNWDVAAGYEACLHIDNDGNEDYGLPVNDELFYEFMLISNNWYEEKLYGDDYFTKDGAMCRAETAAGYVGYQTHGEGMSEFDPVLKSAIYRMLAPLESEFCNTGINANYPIYGDSGYYIGTTDYPEVCCRFFDLFYNPDYDVIVKEGPSDQYPEVPNYGFRTWIKGDNPATEAKETYYLDGIDSWGKNVELFPTYWDQADLTYNYSNRKNAILSGGTAEESSKEADLQRARDRYKEDPIKYSSALFSFDYPDGKTIYDIRGAYSKGGRYQPLRYVYRDEATNEKIADLHAVLKPYIQEQVALFISSRRPVSEVSVFQEELRAMGIDEYDQILADEYAVFKANS